MCPEYMEKGACSKLKPKKQARDSQSADGSPFKSFDKSMRCPFAHHPLELDMIATKDKIKNLSSTIRSSSRKLRNMKPIEPWKPAKSGEIEHTHLMDMASNYKSKKEGEDEDEQKKEKVTKKSIFERENILRKPFDKE